MPAEIEKELWHLIPSVAYFVVGNLMFGASIWIMNKVVPFSLRKEIEEDQNTALAIVMGSVILGLAIILHGAVK